MSGDHSRQLTSPSSGGRGVGGEGLELPFVSSHPSTHSFTMVGETLDSEVAFDDLQYRENRIMRLIR